MTKYQCKKFHNNGQLREVSYCYYYVKHGECKTFYENGDLNEVSYYIYGTKQ
jgi:antitoxin component YwqK of YwqJK toxin-antitoxin module